MNCTVVSSTYTILDYLYTQGIIPTPEEMVAIGNLTQAQFALVTEDNDTRRTPEELNPPCADPFEDLGLQPIDGVTPAPDCVRMRKKRQADVLMSDSKCFYL